MTEKLKVSREVADAIERVKINFSFEEIIASQIKTNRKGAPKWTGYFKPLNNLSAEKLAKALIVGYEVEMTPHEVIAAEYADRRKSVTVKLGFNEGVMIGIKFTLNTLGITIEGVNDNDNN